MARPLRIEYPDACYHVINRGNAGEDIFTTDRDHEVFLEYLETTTARFGIVIHTYCLMTNHYHLLIETPHANLSRAIQWLNVSYATWFNKKHRRQGHLFQGRFKAILIDADEYLLQLSRYIHLNPVKAHMVETPQEYRWSSYQAFCGVIEKSNWLDTSLLAYFGKQQEAAIAGYREFIEKADAETLENPDKLSVGGCILGDKNFVRWVQEFFSADALDVKDIPQLKHLKPGISPEHVSKVVADIVGCTLEDIVIKGRKRNQARDIAINLAIRHSYISCVELGHFFGEISGAAISSRGKLCEKNAGLDENMRKLWVEADRRIVDN